MRAAAPRSRRGSSCRDLNQGCRLLDAGCGPGTVTAGLARAVSPGRVIGLDAAPGVLEHARAHAAEEAVDNVRFVAGDIYDLDVPDAEFDVVYANQLLQHLADPVRAIGEMRRVLKPGGLLAVRDADYATMCPYPKFAEFPDWNRLYHEVAYRNHAEPDAGRTLPAWVRAAGFSEVSRFIPTSWRWTERKRESGAAPGRSASSTAASPTRRSNTASPIRRSCSASLKVGQTWAESDQPFFMFTQIAVLAVR